MRLASAPPPEEPPTSLAGATTTLIGVAALLVLWGFALWEVDGSTAAQIFGARRPLIGVLLFGAVGLHWTSPSTLTNRLAQTAVALALFEALTLCDPTAVDTGGGHAGLLLAPLVIFGRGVACVIEVCLLVLSLRVLRSAEVRAWIAARATLKSTRPRAF